MSSLSPAFVEHLYVPTTIPSLRVHQHHSPTPSGKPLASATMWRTSYCRAYGRVMRNVTLELILPLAQKASLQSKETRLHECFKSTASGTPKECETQRTISLLRRRRVSKSNKLHFPLAGMFPIVSHSPVSHHEISMLLCHAWSSLLKFGWA